MADSVEVPFGVFTEACTALLAEGDSAPWIGCTLDDGEAVDLLNIIGASFSEGRLLVEDQDGRRLVHGPRTADMSVLVPAGSRLLDHLQEFRQAEERRALLVARLKHHGLPLVGADHSRLEHFVGWLDALPEPPSMPSHRLEIFEKIKYFESIPETKRAALELGYRVSAYWERRMPSPCAVTFVHMAYFLRWLGQTECALNVTRTTTGFGFTEQGRSVLATERAAALLDLHEKGGGGLEESRRTLKFAQALNAGQLSPHMREVWARLNRLDQCR